MENSQSRISFGRLRSILWGGWTQKLRHMSVRLWMYLFTSGYGPILTVTTGVPFPNEPIGRTFPIFPSDAAMDALNMDLTLQFCREWPHLHLLSAREHCLRKQRLCGAASDSVSKSYTDWACADLTLHDIQIQCESDFVRQGS